MIQKSAGRAQAETVGNPGGGATGSDRDGSGKGAEGPNRMSESRRYSSGTRPIPQHDSNSAPLSEDYNPSEIATDRIWNHNYNGHAHDMRSLGQQI